MWLHRPEEPAVLAAARNRLDAELARAWEEQRSRGPEPDPLIHHPAILATLMEMTRGTCAYCERGLEAQGSDAAVVTHHRPIWGAVGTAGDVEPRAYWWLTYEWDNLYPACADCVRARGTRFPVAGPRATSPESVADEAPLLLDPLTDDPDDHLRFGADGTITALTQRGRVTCDTLALNRDYLVRARLAVIEGIADDDSFRSLRRQLADATGVSTARGALASAAPSRPSGPELPPMAGAEPGAPGYDLTSDMGGAERRHYFQAAQWIERVVIRNFRPIRELEIDLARSTSERGPWTVLLGENGCGKSSVLHAIALT